MGLRDGIISTAEALGINPVDLATAISYETGGTFDPLKRGPTTQWGQHRGLIQFGEPQARQHGVNWDDPMGSQLGPNGAVASYLRGAGVTPGMGLLDIYSAINAGAPGLYNRSDANNGGAPGTVRDKVEQQMEGHKRKAAALMGLEWTPPQSQQTGGRPMAQPNKMPGAAPLVSTQGTAPQEPKRRGIFNPDVRDRLIMSLEGMTMNPNRALIAQAGGAIADRRKEAADEKSRSATIQWLTSLGRTDLVEAVSSGAITGSQAAGIALAPPEQRGQILSAAQMRQMFPGAEVAEGLYNLKPDGTANKIGGGPSTVVQMPGQPTIGTIPPGYQAVQDPTTGTFRFEPIQGGPVEQERIAEERRKQTLQQQTGDKSSVIARDVDRLTGMIDNGGVFDLPEAGIYGNVLATLGVNQEAVDFKNTIASIQASVAFDTLQKMREASKTGGALGGVSERELDLLISSLGALQQSTSPGMLKENLLNVKRIMAKIESDPVASTFYYGGSNSSGRPASGIGSDGFGVTGRID